MQGGFRLRRDRYSSRATVVDPMIINAGDRLCLGSVVVRFIVSYSNDIENP